MKITKRVCRRGVKLWIYFLYIHLYNTKISHIDTYMYIYGICVCIYQFNIVYRNKLMCIAEASMRDDNLF